MFMGWVAYFTRGHSGRDGLVNYLCLALGLLVGFAAAAALPALGPVLNAFTLPVVVFGVGLLVVSLRALPTLSNVPSYFLGVISVFAAHAAPTLEAFAELGGASAIGSIGAWLASTVQTGDKSGKISPRG
jgi:FtsH-binding integral membrane protein